MEEAVRVALAGVSATTAQLACQPIETVKIRLQLRDPRDPASPLRHYTSFRAGVAALVRDEGTAALWKGMAPAALREMSYSALRYGLFVPVKDALGADADGKVTWWKRFAAGGISGGVGAAVANPTDLLKARMQSDVAATPTRMRAHVRRIYHAGGVRGFWVGVGTTVSRAVVLGATNLGTYSTAKEYLSTRLGVAEGVPLHLSCSLVAGLAIATTTAPIDFARSRVMAGAGPTTGGVQILLEAVRNEGALSVYRGFYPQWARCAPYTVLQYIAWEQLCRAAGVQAV
eukprot:TRINITY_DN15212_c0_g1_i1.p1 TRINITY_DN15212_c0_g1~~TRINITY_DN15212_c0_g1_i1.p1  ORF type:complete len:287 (+),score=76.42 TRINITY_DN15212_c0_g1_i1:84-944(+)